MVNTIRETFHAFFEDWLSRQQDFLQKLQTLSSSNVVNNNNNNNNNNIEQECKDLAAQVFAHYEEFYNKKIMAASEDVFLMFSPPWLSSFERVLLWVSGFKPSTVFPLVNQSLKGELSDEQKEKLEILRGETRMEERDIEKEMAKVQESIAAPHMMELIRRASRLVDGERTELETEMENFKASMVMVMENADGLRGSVVMKLMDILEPVQIIKFLIAAAQFQIQARRWGLQRDARTSSA